MRLLSEGCERVGRGGSDLTNRSQWLSPKSVRSPQTAPTPSIRTKLAPIMRPEVLLLLQPWSTATSHITKSTMAQTPRILIHMALSSPLGEELAMAPEPAKVQASQRNVNCLSGKLDCPSQAWRCSSAVRRVSADTSGLLPARPGYCHWFAALGDTRWSRAPAVR